MTRVRGSYHHGDLRAALVRTATEQARTDGPEGVVLREAARQLGVSHNAAYRHFVDRTELLTEVARTALAELAEAMRAAQQVEDRRRASRKDPAVRARKRLRALGQTYVEFAVAQPGLFRVAFDGLLTDGPGDAEPSALLSAALVDLVEAGVLAADRLDGMMTTCWSAVHGFSVLVLDGPMRTLTPRERDQALQALLDQIDREL